METRLDSVRDARVILRHCPAYDAAAIRTLVREGLEELGLRPQGRTLLKPNLVAAGKPFDDAYTRPEFVEGVLLALRDRDEGAMTELAVGERCGIGMPTRFVFDQAGVNPILARTGAKRYCFDEVPQVEIPLTHVGRLRDAIFTPEPIALADFFVNCPKFKAHPWTTVTFSMKNYIGIQDDRHRLIDHDHALSRKVADLQYIIQPQFIAIDCIIAGEGRMLTPIPRKMNLVVMGNNQVAVDSVCSRIIGLDPREVEHIRLAHGRGFGPIDMNEVRLSGDVTFDEAKERAKGFKVGLVRVEKYFEGEKIQAYAGPPPGHGRDPDSYCWGGCPGAMEEAAAMLRVADAQWDAKLPRIHFVFGHYKGPLDVSYGERVIFVGDCCEWEGELGGSFVKVESLYKDRATLEPRQAKHKDGFVRMMATAKKLREAKKSQTMRLEGCPVSISELAFVLAELGGAKSALSPRWREALAFSLAYFGWTATTLWRWLRGKPYQVAGETRRGAARPNVVARDA